MRLPAGGHASRRGLPWVPLLAACLAAACLSGPAGDARAADAGVLAGRIPATVSQGGLVIARVPAGSRVSVGGRPVRVGADGTVVFGAGRDEKGPLQVGLTAPDGRQRALRIAVIPRDWPIERVDGVPPKTVNPPPAIAARIQREQAAVATARERDDGREDFRGGFAWPVQGRISGRFGNQRVYNGEPKAPHSGMDIAIPQGTPVRAPTAGIVTFANPDLYLTGGTVVLDHGFGLSSNFLHLSKLQVRAGQRVARGQVIALSGMTGRATGPHLHWGFNWFGTRLDPLLLPGIEAP
ncbi:peptidase M23 [Frateuria sp. Soil773]|uniref:M23 family metallopeptidase n=1 Tax=Frateuria sp. Soil773 TaxID=1736407 RepID=UPI00070166B8|nr:M23 family metallopeptidase [Frateuria sp. Soil773]KRE89558.1 peptidase M23 [Frateuria sp. Soil773]